MPNEQNNSKEATNTVEGRKSTTRLTGLAKYKTHAAAIGALFAALAAFIANYAAVVSCVSKGTGCLWPTSEQSRPLLTRLVTTDGNEPSPSGVIDWGASAYDIAISYGGSDEILIDEIRTLTWKSKLDRTGEESGPGISSYLFPSGMKYAVFFPTYEGEARFRLGCPVRLGGDGESLARINITVISAGYDDEDFHSLRLVYRHLDGRQGFLPLAQMDPNGVDKEGTLRGAVLWPTDIRNVPPTLKLQNTISPSTYQPLLFAKNTYTRTGLPQGSYFSELQPVNLRDIALSGSVPNIRIIASRADNAEALNIVRNRARTWHRQNLDRCNSRRRNSADQFIYDDCRDYAFLVEGLLGNENIEQSARDGLLDERSFAQRNELLRNEQIPERFVRQVLSDIVENLDTEDAINFSKLCVEDGAKCLSLTNANTYEEYTYSQTERMIDLSLGWADDLLANQKWNALAWSELLQKTPKPVVAALAEVARDKAILQVMAQEPDCSIRGALVSNSYFDDYESWEVSSTENCGIAERIYRQQEDWKEQDRRWNEIFGASGDFPGLTEEKASSADDENEDLASSSAFGTGTPIASESEEPLSVASIIEKIYLFKPGVKVASESDGLGDSNMYEYRGLLRRWQSSALGGQVRVLPIDDAFGGSQLEVRMYDTPNCSKISGVVQ